MNFKFQLGTKVYFGSNCLEHNSSELLKPGRKAFIVTGASSAKKSGALDDLFCIIDNETEKHFI